MLKKKFNNIHLHYWTFIFNFIKHIHKVKVELVDIGQTILNHKELVEHILMALPPSYNFVYYTFN